MDKTLASMHVHSMDLSAESDLMLPMIVGRYLLWYVSQELVALLRWNSWAHPSEEISRPSLTAGEFFVIEGKQP